MMKQVENEIRIADVVAKKLLSDDFLTEEEECLFTDWLNESENHRILYSKYSEGESFQEFEDIVKMSDQVEQWQYLDRLTRPRRRLNWGTWSACVAGVALLMSLGLWLGLHEEVEKMIPVSVAIIEPGRMQATLILDGGQKILLRDRDTLVNTEFSDIRVRMGQIEYKVKENEQENSTKYNTIMVPRGGIYSLILSDGTKVFLNSESELKYPVSFTGEEREVCLKGEAFFDVTHDPAHPFIVKAGGMQTKVLGTTFNILAYADEPEIKTTLLSGRVEVSVDDASLKKVLSPGMQAGWKIGSNNITVKEADIHIQSLWKDGVIVLNDDELESVMRMLSRWYDVTYEFKGDCNVKHTFTGKINRNEDLDRVLRTLTLLGGPRFDIVGKTVYIY